MDSLACLADVEGSKLTFFKQFNTVYQKLSFFYTNVPLYLFRLNSMLCFVNETKFLKAHKKDLSNKLVPYYRAKKRIRGCNTYGRYHECLKYAQQPF